MFQAASQFNCLEFAGPEELPEDGVTQYDDDPTQGPACAGSQPGLQRWCATTSSMWTAPQDKRAIAR